LEVAKTLAKIFAKRTVAESLLDRRFGPGGQGWSGCTVLFGAGRRIRCKPLCTSDLVASNGRRIAR